MPPKRSTRAASAKPASKPASKPAQGGRTKRSLSPDKPSRPPKRAKTAEVQKTVQIPQSKPYFNPLPVPPEDVRPAPQLFAWGAGNFGQFGMGPDVLGELVKPRKNAWIEKKIEEGVFGGEGAGIEYIAAGGLHSLFIDQKGAVWSCGVNDDAALGRVTKDVPDPKHPGSFMDVDELTSVPYPIQSLVDEDFRAVKLATGDNICAAINSQGDLRVWGSFRAAEGVLGFSSAARRQFTPAPILELSQKPGDSEKVSSIAAGDNHLLVLTTHGNLYTWGAGEQSQLGRRVISRRKIAGTVPEKITLARSRKGRVVGAGAFHSFVVDDAGDVWGWGLNQLGQTGTGLLDKEVSLPTKVVGLSKEELGGASVVAIDGGEHHTMFLTSDGRVFACGRANAGQLGLPKNHSAFAARGEDRDHLREPVLVEFPEEDDPVVNISVGVHNNVAVTENGALYSWGQGLQGELGVGGETEVWTPRIVVRREGGSWAAVQADCGGQHTLGLFRKKT